MAPLPHNQVGITVIVVSTVVLFVDAIVIALRLWSRKLKKKTLKTSDYLVILAWVIALADLCRKGVSFSWGQGLHWKQILAAQGDIHLHDIFKSTHASNLTYFACSALVKISILCVYLELFYCITWMFWAAQTTVVLVIMFFTACIIMTFTRCTPFKANWNRIPAEIKGSHCSMNTMKWLLIQGSLNLAFDLILVILPLPLVWSLKISRLKKVATSAMFGLGFGIIFIVAFRFKLIFGRKMTDITHDGEIPALLGWMEPCLGIISACLPFLTPPIVKVKSLLSDSRIIHYLGSRTSPSRSASKDSSDVDVELNIGTPELKQIPSSHGTVGNQKECEDSIVLPPNVHEHGTSTWSMRNYGTE
jgi:hypothetical protein